MMHYTFRQVMGVMLIAFLTTFWFGAAEANTPGQNDTCISDFQSAQSAANPAGNGTPTTAPTANPSADPNANRDGLLTQITDYIKDVVSLTSELLFLGIVTDSGFIAAVNAAFALVVAFFGAAFMFGIVPLTFGQALTRGVKIAIIAGLIGGGGWTFFSTYAVTFFNDGTDYLIDQVIGIATGDTSNSVSAGGEPQPFRKIEDVIGSALSPEMMITFLTSMTTGPMGLAVGGMLGLGIMSFVMMLVKAMRTYAIALVAKALLFGLAPIFISFILFERTKHIFTGWVNQLVNYSLQPLLLFAFLSFFVVLIESSLENIMGVDICWTPVQTRTGQATEQKFWRFVNQDGQPSGSDFTWEGLVECIQQGGSGGKCEEFPISILDILSFLILSHLAYRFSDVVVHIAGEIASSTLFLDKLGSGLADLTRRADNEQRAG